MTVVLSSWACQQGGWTSGCVTANGAHYAQPITVNLYAVDDAGIASQTPLASVTKTFNLQYRPSSTPSLCAGDQPPGSTWFNKNDATCYHGLAQEITVNFASLLHMCDLRLCTRAQWEFRKVAALMRSEVMKVVPELGRYLQPKCGEHRLGYCDESEKDWAACPIGRVRPHKDALFRLYDAHRRGELAPLREQDWDAIESKDEGVSADGR